MERRLFCSTSCLNVTRLLNTPDIGRLTACVDSSSIDMLVGLSKWPSLRIPPGFWANAAWAANHASDSEPAAASAHRLRFITFASCSRMRASSVRYCILAGPFVGLSCKAAASEG
jgi:hypothetical protein